METNQVKVEANQRQVGGNHYKQDGAVEHWDIVVQHDLDYFQGQITKYVMRWKRKNGIQDLEKALHFLEKYIEVEKSKQAELAYGQLGALQRAAASLDIPAKGPGVLRCAIVTGKPFFLFHRITYFVI